MSREHPECLRSLLENCHQDLASNSSPAATVPKWEQATRHKETDLRTPTKSRCRGFQRLLLAGIEAKLESAFAVQDRQGWLHSGKGSAHWSTHQRKPTDNRR